MTRILAAVAVLLALAAKPAAATTYTLTLSTAGPNTPLNVVTSTPSGIVCPPTCSFSFAASSAVTLGEVNASTMVFAGWTYANGCRTNAPTCTLKMLADTTVGATFNPTFSLSLAGPGAGVVTSSQGVVNCASASSCANGASQSYGLAPGSQVVLIASATTGSSFASWSGDAGCNTASTCTFTLNGYEAIVASFTSTGPYPLSVAAIGSGTVKSSPAGISCPGTCKASFSSGTAVTLTATAASGSFFAGWGNAGCSGTGTCVVTMGSMAQGAGGASSPAAFFYKSQ